MGTVTPIGNPTKRPVQSWNTITYDKNTRFVSTFGEDVVELLAPQHGERILDLGCGDGILSIKIAEAGSQVVGVDASESFIETARSKGVDAIKMDGHDLRFENEFDAVFSNAALHWMLEPEAVIAGVVKALKPGGRFVGEFGGFGNVAAIFSAMRAVGGLMGGDPSLASPCFFPTCEHYAKLLEKAGLSVMSINSFYRPTPLPTEIRGWLETMREPFFEQFGSENELAYSRVIDALRPSLCDDEGKWIADYVRLRFSAELRN
jgi:SAM-dependent methyltransferase